MSLVPSSFNDSGQIDFHQPCMNHKSLLNFPFPRKSTGFSCLHGPPNRWKFSKNSQRIKASKRGIVYLCTSHLPKLSVHHCHKTKKNSPTVLFLLHRLSVLVGRVTNHKPQKNDNKDTCPSRNFFQSSISKWDRSRPGITEKPPGFVSKK